VINKELLIQILNENNWGLYLKSNPLEEMSANVGKIYKINDIEVDKLIEEYNSHFTSPEE
jgi:hypothetical protein